MVFHTNEMPNPDEKIQFSVRLKQALKRSSKKVETATELALQFNLRHDADPVTLQAAQKWLTGQARPTPDKIKTLADWLNVSAQWLRFGISEERPAKDAADKGRQTNVEVGASPTENELLLLSRIRAMPEHRRCLVVELVEQLTLDQEMWRS